jgi:hypothetical protein
VMLLLSGRAVVVDDSVVDGRDLFGIWCLGVQMALVSWL